MRNACTYSSTKAMYAWFTNLTKVQGFAPFNYLVSVHTFQGRHKQLHPLLSDSRIVYLLCNPNADLIFSSTCVESSFLDMYTILFLSFSIFSLLLFLGTSEPAVNYCSRKTFTPVTLLLHLFAVLVVSFTAIACSYRIIQIICGGKVLRLHHLVIRGKTFAIA